MMTKAMKHKFLVILLLGFFTTCISACSTPGYVCPLKDQLGACSSQMNAYQATLNHKADKISIFDSTQVTR